MPEITHTGSKSTLKKILDPLARVYLLVGTDDTLKHEITASLLNAGLDASFSDFDLEHIEFGPSAVSADDTSALRILSAAGAAPFGSPRRVVVVDNIQYLGKTQQDLLAKGLAKLGAVTLLILRAGPVEMEAGRPKGRQAESALKKAAAAAGHVVVCDSPKAEDARQRVLAMLEAAGKTASSSAIAAILASAEGQAGTDIGCLTMETEKLITYVGERKAITDTDTGALLAVVPEERIFALLDAIGTRDMRAAATQLTNLFRSGDRADGIVARTLVMLQRHIRLLCLAHHLGDHGYRGGPVSAELREGLSKELLSTAANQQYRLVTYMKQARNFTWLELRQAMGKILAVDMTMKGIPPMHDLPVRPLAAGDDPESLLKTLVVELCRR